MTDMRLAGTLALPDTWLAGTLALPDTWLAVTPPVSRLSAEAKGGATRRRGFLV